MEEKLIDWINKDDACHLLEDGRIISYHCVSNGKEELDLII